MTVKYMSPLATNSYWGCFTALLFKWRGSVYKLILADYLVFITLYYIIFFIYRFGLNEEDQRYFETIAHYCEVSGGPREMSFVLGFFVTTIVKNWWQLYQLIPWPDSVAHYVNASFRENDPSTKLLRRTVVRYCNLSLALTFQTISPAFKKRYPNLNAFVKEGLLLESEKHILEQYNARTDYGVQWLPISWATDLVSETKRNETKILEELDKFRKSCALLMDYENLSVPLVYVQVVTIGVYTYFILCLVGRQWLIRDQKLNNLNLYFPFFTTIQFMFHMGWFKVAESLINPFGSDDDDFELEKTLKRHIEITHLMMDSKEEYNMKNICHPSKSPGSMPRNGDHAITCDNGNTIVPQNSTKNFMDCLALPPPKFADVVMAVEMNPCYENTESIDYLETNPVQRARSPTENVEASNCDTDTFADDGST